MKTPRLSHESSWDGLLRQARNDTPPAIDSVALLRAVRAEGPPAPQGWAEEFSLLFNVRRVLPACAACTCALALLATWQVWDMWDTLPWAQLLNAAIGGSS